MKTFFVIGCLALSIIGCSKPATETSWQPDTAPMWMRINFIDGMPKTNSIVLGFRSDGVVVWKLGKEVK